MPVKFRKQILAYESYESAGVAHFKGSSHLDIASGAWCYHGPDFRQKSRIWTPPSCHQYYDDFATISMDATGNGHPDIITGGYFGETLFLLQNPGTEDVEEWDKVVIDDEIRCIETIRAWDIDGDGDLEIIPNLVGQAFIAYKLLRDACGRPTGKFQKIQFFDAVNQGHGLGAADMTGNGRLDILCPFGWLEAPIDPWEGEWTLHTEWKLKSPSIPILAHDYDGDGIPELIAGRAHDYGLSWYQRTSEGKGWVEHPIDPFNSQYHDMQFSDIDGDGVPEIVTGKRYYAHNGKDPGADDDVGLYYFKWTGEGFAKQVIDYGPFGRGKGCGISFAIADLNENGRPDVVAPGKDGLCLYWNEGLCSLALT